jgi:hypothetical protein
MTRRRWRRRSGFVRGFRLLDLRKAARQRLPELGHGTRVLLRVHFQLCPELRADQPRRHAAPGAPALRLRAAAPMVNGVGDDAYDADAHRVDVVVIVGRRFRGFSVRRHVALPGNRFPSPRGVPPEPLLHFLPSARPRGVRGAARRGRTLTGADDAPYAAISVPGTVLPGPDGGDWLRPDPGRFPRRSSGPRPAIEGRPLDGAGR